MSNGASHYKPFQNLNHRPWTWLASYPGALKAVNVLNISLNAKTDDPNLVFQTSLDSMDPLKSQNRKENGPIFNLAWKDNLLE